MKLGILVWLASCALFLGAQAPSMQSSEDPAGSSKGAPTLQFGPDQAWFSVPVRLEVVQDALEFLLVNPHGAMHESLFSTEVSAAALNAGLLAMGLEPGKNADWAPVGQDLLDPSTLGAQGPPSGGNAPTRDQYQVIPPSGDGVYLHVAWREGDELFFFRIEDLVRDLDRGRTLRRHRLVYLGSYLTDPSRPGGSQFAATLEGNLINIAFFRNGATLLTTAVVECDKQSNWLPNTWLLPERGCQMQLVFSKVPLGEIPEPVVANLVRLPALQPEPTPDRAR